MAIEDQLRELRTSISQAQGKKLHAQVQLDNAKGNMEEARSRLKNEFGVETTDEARAKLIELQSELDAAMAEVEAALQESGA